MSSDNFIDDQGNFIFSGKPSNIYKYKCFDDRANIDWIDGQEYIDNPNWSQNRKDLWNFFYRPYNYGNNIGKYQKTKIKEVISIVTKLEEHNQLIKTKKILAWFVFFMVLILTSQNFNLWLLFLIPLLMYISFFLEEKELLLKIKFEKEKIYKWEQEIDYLLDKQQFILNSQLKFKQIKKIFWCDLRELEAEVYKDYFFTELDQVKSDIPNFYYDVNMHPQMKENTSNHLSIHPKFPVIPTWGLLQPMTTGGNEHRATGVRAAKNDIAEKIATFRNSSNGSPFYRLWYIQYIFLTEKNFSVISFSYDFITEKKYNVVGDTHQLNHITNSSSGNEDIVHFIDSKFVQSLNLPEELVKNIYLTQVKKLKFSMSSGISYSCFIPSDKVIKGLYRWSELNEDKFLTLSPEDEDEKSYDQKREPLCNNTNVLEILADKVANALRVYIDKSRPLTSEEHEKNRSKDW